MKFHGLPIVGSGNAMLRYVDRTLMCDWFGNVTHIGPPPMRLPKTAFTPIDKGHPGVFGVDVDGKVIVSIALYPGTGIEEDGIESREYFRFDLCNSTKRLD